MGLTVKNDADLPTWLQKPPEGPHGNSLALAAWKYYGRKFYERGHLEILHTSLLWMLCCTLADWKRARVEAEKAQGRKRRLLLEIARATYLKGFLLFLGDFDLEWKPGEPVDLPPEFRPPPKYRQRPPKPPDTVPDDLEGGRAAAAAWKFWAAKLKARGTPIERDTLRPVAEAWGSYIEYCRTKSPKEFQRLALEHYRTTALFLDPKSFHPGRPVPLPPEPQGTRTKKKTSQKGSD